MTLKTYSGSCHCGAVRFEAEVDIADGNDKVQLLELHQGSLLAGCREVRSLSSHARR